MDRRRWRPRTGARGISARARAGVRRLWTVAVLAVIGLGLLATPGAAAPAPAANCATPGGGDAASTMLRLEGGGAAAAAQVASADVEVRAAAAHLAGSGFDDSGERLAYRDGGGATTVHLIYGSRQDPAARAAVVSHRVDAAGGRVTELTMVGVDPSGRPTPLASAPVLPGQPPELSQRRQGYLSCMIFCLSARCGSDASKCNHIVNLPAKFACMAAVCGAHIRACNQVCGALR